jgi:uncharacterized repeat protein (TIGR03803 family)
VRSSKTPRALFSIAAILLMLATAATTASAGDPEKVIYSFNNRNGFAPSGLVLDTAGNLYGTTSGEILTSPCTGTNPRCGTVFELSHRPDGSWTEKNLVNFDGDSGSTPLAGLVFDSAGNLYGTTEYGGPGPCYGYIRLGCGVVFELIPSAGGVWTEKVLYIFTGPNGAYPSSALTLDATGNLYGSTYLGGGGTCMWRLGIPTGCGIIFELTPTSRGFWTEHVLHTFANDGADGIGSYGSVNFDNSGNIYGTTSLGGAYNQGTVFELTADESGWNEQVLFSFGATSADGSEPAAGLVIDSAGNLYGDTLGGGVNNAGTVFELKQAEDGTWKEALLYQFGQRFPGGNPSAGLVLSNGGNLYGTAPYAGIYGDGIAFELSRAQGEDWQMNVLHDFLYDDDGRYPNGVVFDTSGNIYCPTLEGGQRDLGTVVEMRN